MCFWSLILMFGTDWDIFEPFSTSLSCENRFFIGDFEDFVWKWADLSIYKAFVRELLIKALKTLKSAHTSLHKICQWKIDFHNPTMSKMVQTSPNRSQTSYSIIRNTFWTSKSHIRFALKKAPQSPPKKIPSYHSGLSEKQTFSRARHVRRI